MNMSALSYIPGPALGHDDRYEAMESADAALEIAVEARMDELETMRWSAAQPAMDAAMERLADQPDFNRWLFALWQARTRWPGPEETPGRKARRAFAAQQVTNLLAGALASAVGAGE